MIIHPECDRKKHLASENYTGFSSVEEQNIVHYLCLNRFTVQYAFTNYFEGLCTSVLKIFYQNRSWDASDYRKCYLITCDHSQFTNPP